MKKILTFRNLIVRDLAWAILSPPLIVSPSSASQAWCHRQFDAFLPNLIALDRDPTPLEEAIAKVYTPRLGKYFECLVGYWLNESSHFDLLGQNLQIIEDKQTRGELDFVVRDRRTKRISHWEIAVKFYLGCPPIDSMASFHGPGKRDRLDLKIEHIVNHQAKRSEHPAAISMLAECGWKIDESFLFVKGQLFYPKAGDFRSKTETIGSPGTSAEIAQSHHRTWWQTTDEFLATWAKKDWHWHELKKPNWLSDQSHIEPTTPPIPMSPLIDLGAKRPVYVVAMDNKEEMTRGFLVPNGWAPQISPDDSPESTNDT